MFNGAIQLKCFSLIILDGEPADNSDSEFVWEEYLQETGVQAVPPTAFKHVSISIGMTRTKAELVVSDLCPRVWGFKSHGHLGVVFISKTH